jgi:hypothetical protein
MFPMPKYITHSQHSSVLSGGRTVRISQMDAAAATQERLSHVIDWKTVARFLGRFLIMPNVHFYF